MTQLCIAQADHVAPRTESATLMINPCFPCQLGHKMRRNVLEKLVQNGQFMCGWSLLLFHDLLFGRCSSKPQPLFLKILWDGCEQLLLCSARAVRGVVVRLASVSPHITGTLNVLSVPLSSSGQGRQSSIWRHRFESCRGCQYCAG